MPKVNAVAIDSSGVKYSMEAEYDAINDYGQTKVYIQIPDASQYDGSYLYECSAKVDSVGSKNGINNGRISKLYVRDVNTNTEVIGYDCGWYHEPSCFPERAVVSLLLEIFDTPCRS